MSHAGWNNTRLSRRAASASFVVASCCVAVGTAYAQDMGAFQVEHFEPLPAQTTNILNLAGTRPLEHLSTSAGVWMHFVDDPIQVETEGEVSGRLIDDQLKAELAAGLGLFGYGDIGVVLPIVLVQTADTIDGLAGSGAGGFGIGDVRIVPRARLFSAAGFGVALLAPLHVPTGDTATFNGDGGVKVEPRLAVDWRHDSGITMLANLGFQFRPETTSVTYVSDDMFRFGLGASYEVMERLNVMSTLFGHIVLAEGRDVADLSAPAPNTAGQPLEVQLAGRYQVHDHVIVQAGAGAGLTPDVGSPDFRLLASVEFLPQFRADGDGDGILNRDDACPNEAEDVDGFEDEDGCPDLDNDEDFVLDEHDQCPNELEDKDGFEDEDGCPDPDNDQDGLTDNDDRCPIQPGPAELLGCPPEDSDGDGIFDHLDACPTAAEDVDGVMDDDGCPDPDNDADGLLDDGTDECPEEPETFNQRSDDDGCPDRPDSRIRMTFDGIELLEPVTFYSGSKIRSAGRRTLMHAASALENHGNVEVVRIEATAADEEMATARADAVRDYLIERGVREDLLVARGQIAEEERVVILFGPDPDAAPTAGPPVDAAADDTDGAEDAASGGEDSGFHFDEEDVSE